MRPIREISRRNTPFLRPQGLAWDGRVMWMTSVETDQIYAVDLGNLGIRYETSATGKPWGIGANGNELRVVCAEVEGDRRVIRRCPPFGRVDPSFALHCPDDCGSHLSWDGRRWHLSQWYPRKLLRLDDRGVVDRVFTLPRDICGHTYAKGKFYFLTTTAEDGTDYQIMELDPLAPEPQAKDVAQVPFQARALAFDGKNFWTNHREKHQTVCFNY